MIPSAALGRFGLLLVRPGMLVSTVPVFGGTFVPPPVRVGLTLLLAFVLAPHVAVPSAAGVPTLVLVAGESIVGLALGMGVRATIAAAELGGHLAGFQLGLSYAALVDPQSGVRNNVLATLYGQLALIAFFGINGHHALISALAATYAAVPIGGVAATGGLALPVTTLLGLVFETGLRMAMPVITVLLLVELILGLLARAAPAFNLMVVGTPIRLVIGLIVLLTTIQVVPPLASASSRAAMDATLRLVRALH